MPELNGYRTWAEVDLDNLVYNYKFVRDRVFPSDVMCVIKADAYGHGAPQTALALEEAGASCFAVSGAEEAMQLRRHGVSRPVLVLGHISPEHVRELAENDVMLTVGSPEIAASYTSAFASIRDDLSKRAKLHIKIETGMNRLGFDPDTDTEAIIGIAAAPCFEIAGAFTHLSAADEMEASGFTGSQIAKFIMFTDVLKRRGIQLPVTHCANSAGVISYPESYMSIVRPGIILYGSNPTAETVNLRPVMSLRTRVVQVNNVKRGGHVGYGRTWTATRDSVTATLAVGYADGLPRILSGKMDVLINGRRVRQVGRICMDMCMVDITDVPGVNLGDIATVIGSDRTESQSADELATLAGTISYELFCAVGKRVPRVYIQNGQITHESRYLDKL